MNSLIFYCCVCLCMHRSRAACHVVVHNGLPPAASWCHLFYKFLRHRSYRVRVRSVRRGYNIMRINHNTRDRSQAIHANT
ncbi:hypothetical protein CBM2600_B10313 [Cupriavidus taiwanensis]|nr:hypothetical protein CBM2600_B10313 [Cupriavidus taiwanensis]